MKTGTCYFPTIKHAVRYYSDYENNPKAAVARKLAEGLIHIGRPWTPSNQKLHVEDNRYFITEAAQ